jgi:nitrogen fixation protein NifU and related proteins
MMFYLNRGVISMYSKKMMEFFRNPHNMGKIEKADGTGKVGNPVCGDVMYLYIKVKNDKISDIKFETFGCASAIATSSAVTDLAKGRTLDDALKITKEDVAKFVDGLPPIKMHCSLLAIDALKAAIVDYRKKKK